MFSVIFPGQGSQYVGMGYNWYENYSEAKKIFNHAIIQYVHHVLQN